MGERQGPGENMMGFRIARGKMVEIAVPADPIRPRGLDLPVFNT